MVPTDPQLCEKVEVRQRRSVSRGTDDSTPDPHKQRGSAPWPYRLFPGSHKPPPIGTTHPGTKKLASCLDCRRTLDRHCLSGAGVYLLPPDWCGWCGRALSGDAKVITERGAAARQTDLLEACRIVGG